MCGTTSRPALLPSSSPDVEGSTRLLHSLGAEAYAARSPSTVESSGRPAPRRAGSRSTRKATPSSSRSPPRRARGGGGVLHRGPRLRPDPGPRPDCTRGRPSSPMRATSVATFNASRCIAAAGDGRRARLLARTAQLVEIRARDLGEHRLRTSAPGARLPARRGRLPRAQEPVPHQPAGASDTLPQTRAGASEVVGLRQRHDAAPPHPGPDWVERGRRDSRCRRLVWPPTPTLTACGGSARSAALPALVLATAAQTLGSESGLAEHPPTRRCSACSTTSSTW